MTRVLCIGGLDPSGGAGLLADAATVTASGGVALAVATAITAQSAHGIRQLQLLPPALVVAQIEQLWSDAPPQAVKLGMLGSTGVAEALSKLLARRLERRPLVIDPVHRSSRGVLLFRGPPAAYRPLFRQAAAITPNLPEASWLLGQAIGPRRRDREAAARALAGTHGLILKGGHGAGRWAEDLVWQRGRGTWLAGRRLPGSKRGTGCRFAAALATRLALGDELLIAARFAKRLVRRYLAAREHRSGDR